MATINQCKELAKTIENGIKEICKSKKSFFVDFVAHKYETNDEGENKAQGKSIEKMFQRIKRGESCTKESLCKLKEIYRFLLDKDEYQKLSAYKPLLDNGFEREILGDEHRKRVEKTANQLFLDKSLEN